MGTDAVTITKCRGCSAPISRRVFEMDPMPLAGAFADTREDALAVEKLPLTWLQCDKCELVQVAEDVLDEVLYSRYCYASSTVAGLVEHFDTYAQFLADRFGHRESLNVLEIGCNDGVLLRRLPPNWHCVGVDPSDVAAEAEPGGYELVNKPFTADLDMRGFDLVLASNCLAHISDIGDTIEAASKSLADGGEFWVEVHDLDATVASGQWDTIYHEHKAEYSARSLSRVVVPHGFRVSSFYSLPLHGGLLRMGFIRGDVGSPIDRPSSTSLAYLTDKYEARRIFQPAQTLAKRKAMGNALIAYGAAGRATVWFNQFSGMEFAAVVDDSPLRVGKFVPGVGWPIVSWEDRPESDACLITAWNYAKEIRNKRQEYSGEWYQTWQ